MDNARPDADAQLIDRRLRGLERRSRMAILTCGGWALLATAALLMGQAPGPGEDRGVLRARALILEDADGRPRVAIGAPIPRLDGRRYAEMPVMANPRVEEGRMVWEIDEGAEHAPVTGMIVLDARGYDRIVVGDPKPNPAVGKKVYPRRASSWGIQINDSDGTERSGYGVAENGQVSLGLDWRGREAVILYGLPGGRAGINIASEDGAATAQITADATDGAVAVRLRGDEPAVELLGADGGARARLPADSHEPE